MVDQPQNPLVPPSASPDTGERKPAIRTMKSDVETFFKTTKPSLIQIIGREGQDWMAVPVKMARGKHYFIAGAIAAALLLLAGGVFLLIPKEGPTIAPPKLVPPPALFAVETSRTVTVGAQNRAEFLRLMEDSVRETERPGTIKRVSVKLRDGEKERFAGTTDFFNFYRIKPPEGLLENFDQNLMIFIYYGESGKRLGIAARSRDPDRTLKALLTWEPSLLRDFQPLFFDEKPDFVVAPFEDRTYRNIDWRFLKLSPTKDLGIGHTIFPAKNLVVVTMGKEAMETVINRLFDAR